MDKNKIIMKAQRLAQKGYIEKAISEYQKILNSDRSDIIVRLRLGDLYAKKGYNEEAIKEYMEVANVHFKRGFSLKTIAVYKQILKLDENNVDIHLKLADLYKKQGLTVDAMHHYAFVIRSYEEKGSFSEIAAILRRLVEVDPENISIRIRLIKTEFQLENTGDALSLIDDTSDWLSKKGDLDNLERFYKKLIDDGVKDKKIVRGLIDIYSGRDDKEGLLDAYRDLIAILEEEGTEEEIKDICKEIIKLSPSDPYALKILGESYKEPSHEEDKIKAEVGFTQENEAEEAGSEGLEAETQKDAGAVDLKITGEVSPQKEFDEEDLLEVEEIEEDIETHYNMGIAYMEMGLYEEAVKEFELSSLDSAFEFDSYNRLGLCFVAMGRYPEACKFFETGLSLSGRDENEYKGLTYELALACEMSGDIGRALELFKKVWEMDDNYRQVGEKIEELSKHIEKGEAST